MDIFWIIVIVLMVLMNFGICFMSGKASGIYKYQKMQVEGKTQDFKEWLYKEIPKGFFRSALQGLKECYTPPDAKRPRQETEGKDLR